MAGTSSAWEMGGLLALVGRSDDCQFVLDDSSISQHHACLVRTPLGAWVVDMGAREGVHVNGTRVRWAWLADGDLIRLGLFTMVFRYDRPPDGIGRDDVPLEAGASPTGWIADDPDSTDRDRRALAVRRKASPTDLMSARVSLPADLPAAPATVNRGEWEPMLAAGPSPLAMWQQQMQLMETFHRDMAMMVQMFVAMHREFQASVRGELDRVQELTRELSRLNKRLNQLPEPAGAGPAPEASRSKPKLQPGPQERSAATGTRSPAPPPGSRAAGRTVSRGSRSATPVSTATPRRPPVMRRNPEPARQAGQHGDVRRPDAADHPAPAGASRILGAHPQDDQRVIDRPAGRRDRLIGRPARAGRRPSCWP